MRHALMHPAYPDIVRQSVAEHSPEDRRTPANDDLGPADEASWTEALFQLAARIEIETNRIW